MFRRFLPSVVGGVFLLSISILVTSKATAAPLVHPKLHRALYEMKEARNELENAKVTFGGHKVKAIEGLDAAIKEVDALLAAAGEPFKGFKSKEPEKKAAGPHPYIHNAINECRIAHEYLKESPDNFEGHKVRALKDLEFAIHQLERALEFAKK